MMKLLCQIEITNLAEYKESLSKKGREGDGWVQMQIERVTGNGLVYTDMRRLLFLSLM